VMVNRTNRTGRGVDYDPGLGSFPPPSTPVILLRCPFSDHIVRYGGSKPGELFSD